jgi:capsular exopolysaccharide synthesis family protein
MELTRIWQVIRRRRWIIVQALIVVPLVALVGSYFVTPSYKASSTILIKKVAKSTPDPGHIGLAGLSSIISAQADVDVNRVLATSRPYIEQMVLKLQLRDEAGNLVKADRLTGRGAISAIMARVFPQASISISQYQDTDLLQIKAESSDPEQAMMMVNTLGEIMIDENQAQMQAEYKSARIFLQDEIGKVKNRYNEALLQITDFKKREKTLDLKVETRLAAEKMAALLKEKEDNIIDLAQVRAKLGRLKAQLAKQRPEFVSASSMQESPQIRILKERLTELRLQLTQATAELTENHPLVQSLKKQIRMAEAELKKEIEVYRSSAPELVALERQFVSLEAHLKGVNADIDKYFKALGGLPDKVYKQASLDMEVEVTQQTYSFLLDSMYQIGMAEATTLSEIRVVEPAVRPVSPISPNKVANGVLGVLLGLVFGTGLAFILEYLDDTIRTPEDVKEFEPLGLIGTVPGYETGKTPLISVKDPNEPLCESYRKIRNFLTMNKTPMRTLLITSAGPEEGKSTTAVNLGISIAREGRRVAILDMDLRRPSLHAYFELPNEIGMADLLQENTALDKAIQTTHVDGLSIISSGPPFPDPGGLIESDQMGRLISELKTRFDVVILDSAPVLIKSDALVLAKCVDGSILVLESGRTTRHAVHELIEMLARANIEALGFVLNRFSIEKGKYYYHQRYYGGYGRKWSASESG